MTRPKIDRSTSYAALVLAACCGCSPGVSADLDPDANAGADVTASGTYQLVVSTSAARSAPVALAGATLSGAAYVFTSNAARAVAPAGITQVRYWLDVATSAAPTHVENFAAYDFVGTDGAGNAMPLDTTKLASGSHTLTESVTTTAGAVQTDSATFTVGAAHGPPPPPPPSTACPTGAVALSTYGAAGAGGDDTAVLQKAITGTAAAHQVLRVPAGTYHISPIHFPSNASVCFDSGATVEARAGWGQFDIMLGVSNASNVQILGYGATFHMDKSLWASDPDPEYRHCVSVTGSSNVHLAGFKCVSFGGDGIYLGGNSSGVIAEDITTDGAARDGLTVISAKDSTVRRCHFNNGHTAVDMEPNVATDAIVNVHLEDSDSNNNNYGGVNVSTYAYTSASPAISVTILRHHDSNSGLGKTDFHAGTSFSANGTNGIAVGGSVLFDQCTSTNAGSRGAWAAWWTANGPNVTFRNLTIVDPNQNHTAVDNAAVAVGRGGGGVGEQGNADFIGTTITDSKGNIDYYFTFYDGSDQPFSKVQFVNPGTLSGAKKAPPNGLFNGTPVNSVNQ